MHFYQNSRIIDFRIESIVPTFSFNYLQQHEILFKIMIHRKYIFMKDAYNTKSLMSSFYNL